jgi:hypothetical protein
VYYGVIAVFNQVDTLSLTHKPGLVYYGVMAVFNQVDTPSLTNKPGLGVLWRYGCIQSS